MASNDLVPAADSIGEGALIPPGDSFALLSKPTLDLTFDDIVVIARDLRAKRVKFLAGQADKPAARKKETMDLSDEAKAARAEHIKGLLPGLKLDLP